MPRITEKLKIIHRKLSELTADVRNARTHSPFQVEQIMASITEYGFTNPVLIDENNQIIAGHGRAMAAQNLDMDRVPCIVLAGLSENQRRAYVLADNKLALNAGWDEALLTGELMSLIDLGCDMNTIGFSDKELEKLGVANGQNEPITGELVGGNRHLLMIECDDENSLSTLFEEMSGRGLQCKILE